MIVGTTAAPQTETTASTEQSTAPAPDPLGTIDGAKNPELIPDEVALRMIVLAVAEPADATEAQKERALAKLNPIGLSEEDTVAFLNLLAEFQGQADALDKQAAEVYLRAPFPHPASTDYQQLANLGNQKSELISNTAAAVPLVLSQDGLLKLTAYLPQAKTGMKIIPDMASSK
jgi:hypothetical protein